MSEFPEFRHNREDRRRPAMTDKCIFSADNAFGRCADPVGLFFLPRGCVCYPDDQLQLLCAQHLQKAGHLDGIYEFVYWGA